MIQTLLSRCKDRIEGAVEDRGQVGIGTLIVFIAMVLVAAIAAGVLINTAGFLQTKSEQTGQESSAQVSNRVQVVSGFGNVGNDEKVDYLNLTVMRGSGSDDINLSAATIEWIGPNRATTLTKVPEAKDGDGSPSGDNFNQAIQLTKADGSSRTAMDVSGSDSEVGDFDYFDVTKIKDPSKSVPVLDEQDDRFKIMLNTTAITGQRLSEGSEVELKLTTQYGAVTIYRANVPQSLSQENAVTV
ncbi:MULTISPECIES: archaellin/type IV pilin N-terminal domain-containing protein [Halorussus]|uniref:archaellin/type IV pilin N-terminal domain-containing protein n=1 Tax=Halorussus TaxID=1070314 RepID=UPI00209D3D64|nr:archaellin/type IV pilin N-terminal domain-containing protein [Halorussus vallis]USZ77667.1 flagellin [Halorussus vallis]